LSVLIWLMSPQNEVYFIFLTLQNLAQRRLYIWEFLLATTEKKSNRST